MCVASIGEAEGGGGGGGGGIVPFAPIKNL